MAGQTTNLHIPYPTGTDRVADGDNAMQSLAERVEARMPWGWLAYVQITANQTGLNGNVGIAGLGFNFTALATRRYRISAYAQVVAQAANLVGNLWLQGDGAQLQASHGAMFTTVYTTYNPVWVGGLTAGSHRVDVIFGCSGPTATLVAAANLPAWLLVEDIGPLTIT